MILTTMTMIGYGRDVAGIPAAGFEIPEHRRTPATVVIGGFFVSIVRNVLLAVRAGSLRARRLPMTGISTRPVRLFLFEIKKGGFESTFSIGEAR